MGLPKRAAKNPWPTRGRRRSRDFDVKKIAILGAAAKLFRDRGYEATSLNELAKMLNVSKPTIYYYFASKDEILSSIKEHTHNEIVRMLLEVRASNLRGIDKIAEAMRRYVHIIASDYGRVVVLIHDRALKKKSRAAIRDRTEEIDSHLFAIYDETVTQGDIRPVERHVMHYTLFGALNWNPNWYNPEGKVPPEKLAELQVALLIDGLRKRE